MLLVVVIDLKSLTLELVLEGLDVHLKFLAEGFHTVLLEGNEVVEMDEVVPQGHLVLIFRLVETLVEHDDVGRLGVELVEVLLHLDGNRVSELLGLTDSENLPPIGFQLGLVDCNNSLLIVDGILQIVSPLFDLLLVIALLQGVELLVLDISSDVLGSGFGGAALESFTEKTHTRFVEVYNCYRITESWNLKI